MLRDQVQKEKTCLCWDRDSRLKDIMVVVASWDFLALSGLWRKRGGEGGGGGGVGWGVGGEGQPDNVCFRTPSQPHRLHSGRKK